jgi:hypothetical protein
MWVDPCFAKISGVLTLSAIGNAFCLVEETRLCLTLLFEERGPVWAHTQRWRLACAYVRLLSIVSA